MPKMRKPNKSKIETVKTLETTPAETVETTPVVELKKPIKKAAKPLEKKKHKKFDADAFYAKYSHVVKGSVKDVERGSVVDGCKATHGRICQIKCQESGKLRTINVQDAWQVKYSREVQKKRSGKNRTKKLHIP